MPKILGISGLSGSGKTWLAELIQTSSGIETAVLCYDDYYLPTDLQMKDENGFINYDLPTALDHKKFGGDLMALAHGNSVQLKKYAFETSPQSEKYINIGTAPLIIAEGIFVFGHPVAEKLFNARIFVEADPEVVLRRRLLRDSEERGISHQKSMYQWNNHVLPAFEKFIAPYKAQCDLVINNHEHEDFQMAQINRLLKKLDIF